MRIYHFLSADFGLEDIEHRRLKIARLADLNDPFEGLSITLPNKQARGVWQVAVEMLGNSTGLLCFSKDWSNPVQWSHYADRHRGLCLGFDVPDVLAKEVIYRERPYPSRMFDRLLSGNENAANIVATVLRTKFSHWQYEREVRLFEPLEEADEQLGNYFSPFSPRLRLTEVIVGHRSTVTRAQVADALGDLAASVMAIKARLAFKSYRVVRQLDGSLWP